jgi:hypothetical protein
MATNNSLQRLSDHLAKSSGDSLSLRQRTTSLALRAESNILLLDISGSMDTRIEGSKRRIDCLWDIVQQMRASTIPFRTAVFSYGCEWNDAVIQPQTQSSTNLAGALDFIAQARPQQVTIVTDGEPDSIEEALEAAKRLECKINVLFVGDPYNKAAIEFCRALAQACNGSYAESALTSEQLQLEASASMQRLLLSANEADQQSARKGVIQL